MGRQRVRNMQHTQHCAARVRTLSTHAPFSSCQNHAGRMLSSFNEKKMERGCACGHRPSYAHAPTFTHARQCRNACTHAPTHACTRMWAHSAAARTCHAPALLLSRARMRRQRLSRTISTPPVMPPCCAGRRRQAGRQVCVRVRVCVAGLVMLLLEHATTVLDAHTRAHPALHYPALHLCRCPAAQAPQRAPALPHPHLGCIHTGLFLFSFAMANKEKEGKSCVNAAQGRPPCANPAGRSTGPAPLHPALPPSPPRATACIKPSPLTHCPSSQ